MSPDQLDTRSYVTKYRRLYDEPPGALDEISLLMFFETLNRADLTAFLQDLLDDDPWIVEIIAPNRGDSLLPTARVVFAKLSVEVQRLLAAALFLVFREISANAKSSIHQLQKARDAIRLASVLPGSETVTHLRSAFERIGLPAELRWEILRSLANHATTVPIDFWMHVDVKSSPESAGLVVRALVHHSPEAAIRRLFELPGPPADATSLEYPLRAVVRQMIGSPRGQAQLQQVRIAAPVWLQTCLDYVLALPDFAGAQVAPTLWAEHCEEVGDELAYAHFGYFSQTPILPECFRAFLTAYGERVALTRGRDPRTIHLVPQAVVSQNIAVDEVFGWRTLLVEPGYLTKKRAIDKDVVPIGSISYFGIVLPKEHRNSLEHRLVSRVELAENEFRHPSLVSKKARKVIKTNWAVSLGKIYQEFLTEGIRIVVQPSTTNEDETVSLFEERIATGGLSPSARAHSQITEFEEIKSSLLRDTRASVSVAFLDWHFAVKTVWCAPTELDLYVGRYDRPIPVGFFYPRDDAVWARNLQTAVEVAMVADEGKHAEFIQMMDWALVDLDGEFARPRSRELEAQPRIH